MITGTYNLIADPSWVLLQIQELRLECDTTAGPVTINDDWDTIVSTLI